MTENKQDSGDFAELFLTYKERIAAAVIGKTTFEEKRIAIKNAKMKSFAKMLFRRGPGIIAYLQSCDRPQTPNEILDGIDRLEKSKRSLRIKRLCKNLVLMDEIQGEKIGDTWYFSAKAPE